LRLHQHHLFRQTIRRVSFFRVTAPQIVFLKRHGCELWISADRADRHEFAHVVLTGLLHQLCAHHEIVVEEFAGILLVGSNAADYRRQVNDQVGSSVGEQTLNVSHLNKVVINTARDEYLDAREGFQFCHKRAAEKTCASGDDDLLVRES
jgi:hypothetical protein